MRITHEKLQLLEQLHHFGTRLDATVLEEARAACRGLEITQTGNCVENCVYAQASGGVGIMLSLEIENISDRVIPIKEVHLEMPWPDADFHWLKRLSSKRVWEFGGYVLPACGPAGFAPEVVLNHRLVRNLKLYPQERIEGLLLGEGKESVPGVYPNFKPIPMRLIVLTGNRESFERWVELSLIREERQTSPRATGKRPHPKTQLVEKTR